jgi:uncharacterized protein YndB with AHSA1/START domain
MTLTDLQHQLERTLDIRATRDIVFSFFTDADRWAAWWGAGSTIEPHAGGRLLIRYPNGTEVLGAVVEITPPSRLVFTYGYATGQPVPPGASLVTIELEERGPMTRVHLTHAFDEPSVRDVHVQGWRYQLSLFANAVADHLHAGAHTLVDRWFAAWSNTDASSREQELQTLSSPGVTLRDRYSAVQGVDDLLAHVAAAQRFMPGLTMERRGDVRQCQGMVLADWVVRTADGREPARGTNLFEMSADGRVDAVTGFWQSQ